MRSPLGLLVTLAVALVVTVGAAVGSYIGVRQFVVDSPIELPALPQFNAANSTPRPTNAPPTPRPTTAAPDTTPAADSDSTRTATAVPTNSDVVAAPAAYTDPRRFTILLMGIDQRPGEAGPFRTDTMMILSLDPVRKTGAMLSIPRDTYVEIPGSKPERINAANQVGELIKYPGGGPALAKKAVERLLGIRIDAYVIVNFIAFETIINALGTIEVCPADRIYDKDYPATDSYATITVEFQPGCQELDATRLLQYARVRHDGGGDVGRSQRQQEVIRAVRKKVLSLGGVSALLSKATDVYGAMKDNIKTDLTFEQIVQLAQTAQGIDNIQSAVLDVKTAKGGQLLTSTLDNGDQVLVPVYEEVYALVGTLFNPTRGGVGDAQASAEGATLRVLNGTGTAGLAGTTSTKLSDLGFAVVETGNADEQGSYGRSEIRVYTGKINTARFLAQSLGLDGTAIVESTDGPPGVDIDLIIGKDLSP